jgi:N-glycosylase/DNA lyase
MISPEEELPFAFLGVIGDTALVLAQRKPITTKVIIGLETSVVPETISQKVKNYLSVSDDIYQIESSLAAKDPVMKEAVLYSHGLRILTQDPWECLASYILSINNNIPAIQRIIDYLCRCYGKRIDFGEYSFPSPQDILNQPKGSLRMSRCGFRDKYLEDAAEKVVSGKVNLELLFSLSTDEARETLMSIRGVGPKVADCVLLFAYHRLDVFPVDVWIARAMSNFYMDGSAITPKDARQEGSRRFGDLAGYAQEYLFFYARNSGLFKRKSHTLRE